MAGKRAPRVNSLEWLEAKYPTEDSARRLFESLIWPHGPHCPHCGSAEVWRFRKKGRKSRAGLFECRYCSGQFTVTTKTPMHATKLPLKVWLRALYLILISSKGVSSVILGKQLGVRQPTAWKIAHAIREMTDDRDGDEPLLGKIVEVDTTFMGAPPRKKKSRFHKYVWNPPGKGSARPQVAVAASRDGRVAAAVIEKSDAQNVGRFLDRFVSKDAVIMSDDDRAISRAAKAFKEHSTVTHGDDQFAIGSVHANRAESLASLLKRAQLGVFHFISRKHLQRYVDELMFRRNQRRVITHQSIKDGTVTQEIRYRNFDDQLADLLKRAVGRQVRRSRSGGLEWPPPIAPGFALAPSASP
ncbi:IS1595 family transposase [Afifella pfennigii]|uniref:IS1595 family transposase n=1 Tax=Afifella pfennigii TaxID=209897 RepID=UPI00068D0D82|nr:IS1595 family transposase [Afifella pfennigii]